MEKAYENFDNIYLNFENFVSGFLFGYSILSRLFTIKNQIVFVRNEEATA